MSPEKYFVICEYKLSRNRGLCPLHFFVGKFFRYSPKAEKHDHSRHRNLSQVFMGIKFPERSIKYNKTKHTAGKSEPNRWIPIKACYTLPYGTLCHDVDCIQPVEARMMGIVSIVHFLGHGFVMWVTWSWQTLWVCPVTTKYSQYKLTPCTAVCIMYSYSYLFRWVVGQCVIRKPMVAKNNSISISSKSATNNKNK